MNYEDYYKNVTNLLKVLDFQLEYLKERKEVIDLCVNAFIDSLPNEGEDADEDRETFNKNIGEFNEITSELVDLIRETDQLSTSYQRKYHFNEQKN